MIALKVRNNIEVEIKEIDYHRGTIPILRGEILFLVGNHTYSKYKREFQRIFKKFFKGIVKDAKLSYYLDYLSLPVGGIWDGGKFSTSFTEFLYPGSPGLGYGVHVRYYEEVSPSEIKSMLADLDSLEEEQIPDEAVDSLCKLFNEYVRDVNSYLYKGERTVWKFTEKLKKDSMRHVKVH